MAEPLGDRSSPPPDPPREFTREPTEEQWRQIQQDLFAERLIQAIKLYRQATGVGLKEAKDAMDAYRERLLRERPEQFSVAPSKSGCMSMILLAVGVASAGAATAAFLA